MLNLTSRGVYLLVCYHTHTLSDTQCMCIYTLMYSLSLSLSHTHARAHTQTHTHTHTHIHHTHTRLQRNKCSPRSKAKRRPLMLQTMSFIRLRYQQIGRYPTLSVLTYHRSLRLFSINTNSVKQKKFLTFQLVCLVFITSS